MRSSKPSDSLSNFLHFFAVFFVYWAGMLVICYTVGSVMLLFCLMTGQIPSGKFPDLNHLFVQPYPQTLLFVTALVVSYKLWEINKNAYSKEGIKRVPFNTNQQVFFELNLPFDQAFELCDSSVRKTIPLWRAKKSDADAGIIQFVVKSKRLEDGVIDRGSLLTFTLSEKTQGIQKVTLTSKSRVLFPLADNAAQQQRIQAILEFIEQHKKDHFGQALAAQESRLS